MIQRQEKYFVGDAKLWRFTVTKNGGTAWTGLTVVTLVLIDPAGKRNTHACSLESGDIWRYVGSASDLYRPGKWTVLFNVTDGSYPNSAGRWEITVEPVTGG